MYNDMIHRNDELKWDLEQADRKAAYGWRVWTMQSGESRWLDTAVATLGRVLIAAGQWLMAARGEAAASGQFGLPSAA